MADIQHSTLPSASVHEPKHITINGTSASGKVITNSGSVTGVSEYRFLDQNDITGLRESFLVLEIDSSVQQTHYIAMPYNGDIVYFQATPNSAYAGGTNTYELQIGGVSVTGSQLSVTPTPGTGGTAGDIVAATPSAANTANQGDSLTIVCTANAQTDATVDTRFTILIERT